MSKKRNEILFPTFKRINEPDFERISIWGSNSEYRDVINSSNPLYTDSVHIIAIVAIATPHTDTIDIAFMAEWDFFERDIVLLFSEARAFSYLFKSVSMLSI